MADGDGTATARLQLAARRETRRAREESRRAEIDRIRFGHDGGRLDGSGDGDGRDRRSSSAASIKAILTDLAAVGFGDHELLAELRQRLASGEDLPETVVSTPGALSGMVGAILGGSGGEQEQEGRVRLAATQALANLCPLREHEGVQVSRQAGPALVTLLSSGSSRLQEAAAVAIGNLTLAGPKAAKVLLNQEALESLIAGIQANPSSDAVVTASLYALYHLMHWCHNTASRSLLDDLVRVGQQDLGKKQSVERCWLLFTLSCNAELHEALVSGDLVSKMLDLLTYEIFQKSDSRPLVKTVTPAVRCLSNLCAGAEAESACQQVLRHADFLAILVALLGTNFAHLSKESLHWFSNIVNCESMLVQEVLVDLDFLDKMEYHTVQAIHKLDPYLTNVIH